MHSTQNNPRCKSASLRLSVYSHTHIICHISYIITKHNDLILLWRTLHSQANEPPLTLVCPSDMLIFFWVPSSLLFLQVGDRVATLEMPLFSQRAYSSKHLAIFQKVDIFAHIDHGGCKSHLKCFSYLSAS